MNRLVNTLMAHPQVIEQMAGQAGQEGAPFGSLLDALGDVVFSESELRRIQEDLQLRQRLESSYLPTISAPDWEYALSLTENRTVTSSGWWTVMVAGTSGHFGLTAPQNGVGPEQVALFTGPAESAWILAYDPALGTISEVTGLPHCGAPSRGCCYEGSCHGCAPSEVYDEATGLTGIKCQCSHQDE
jgi:hypothetical protein